MGKIAGAQIREGKIEKRERERYIFYADEPRLDGCSFSLSLSLSLSLPAIVQCQVTAAIF
jgi:hypothetical protein